MQALVYLVICCIMLSDFLVKTFSLPGVLHFLPELCSVMVTLYVIVVGTRDHFRLVAPKYWIVFGALAVIVLCGVINNSPGTGPILSGMRFYLRAIPMFFLAAVMPNTEQQVKRQLTVLLGFGFLQLPLAVVQRWNVLAQGRYTGDEVQGTLMDSGILSIYLICIVLVLTGFMLKKRIGKLSYALLIFVTLFPSAINETKATLVLLPGGLLMTLIMGADRGKRLRYAGLAVLGFALFLAFFIPVYNMMEAHNPNKGEKDITNYFTDEKQLKRYISSDVGGVGTTKDVRRGDAIEVPLAFLSRDPAQLGFGLGLGSVSPSNFGKNFEGSYFRLFQKFLITTFTVLLLEFGVLGLLTVALLFWLIFSDTLVVARSDDYIFGALATGWSGVIALVAVGLLYTIIHQFTSITYLSWYFSGMVCARRVALQLSSVKARVPVPLRAHTGQLESLR